MASAMLDLGQWNAYQRQIERLLKRDVSDVMRAGATRAAVTLDRIARTELPPPVRTRPQAAHWTAKQRRWWWGTMRAKALGKSQALPGWKAAYRKIEGRTVLVISGSYKRTGTLVRSLTYDIRQTADMTEVRYGTNRAYAKWVIDRESQATYHKGNWATLQDMAERNAAKLQDAFADGANAKLAELLRR
jgi:hypothetical protein